MKDHYKTLELNRAATEDDVKKSFRRLAKLWHPDRNPGDKKAEALFRDIQEAYEVLRDADRRKSYDAEIDASAARRSQTTGGRTTWSSPWDSFDEGYRRQFGDKPASSHRTRDWTSEQEQKPAAGKDRNVSVEVDAGILLGGGEVDVRAAGPSKCGTCHGSGRSPKVKEILCGGCAGTGRVSKRDGFMTVGAVCEDCGGRGTIGADCPGCGGLGTVDAARTLKLKIPPGTSDGTSFRIPGQGHPAASTSLAAGDLVVTVRAKSGGGFEVAGCDLKASKQVPFSLLACGGPLEVPSLDGGMLKVNVAPGTQSGTVLRLRGKGLPAKGGARGDILVQVYVQVPKATTDRQKDLLRQFEQSIGKPDAESGPAQGFGSSIKEAIADILGG